MTTDLTRQYWLDTVLGWAEARLPGPQFDECKAALTGATLTPSPRELARNALVDTALEFTRFHIFASEINAAEEAFEQAAAAYRAILDTAQ